MGRSSSGCGAASLSGYGGSSEVASRGDSSAKSRCAARVNASVRPDFVSLPFTSLYLTDDEFAAEVANRTVHGILHIGQVPDATGGYRLQGAVLVRPNALFGNAYMAAIRLPGAAPD